MKKACKRLALVLCVALCLGMMAAAVSAAEAEQDGLKLILTTDKEAYVTGEQIVATAEVVNISGEAVPNVNLKIKAPNGVDLVGGAAEKTMEALDAEAADRLEAVFLAEVPVTPPTGDKGILLAVVAAILSCGLAAMLVANRKSACLALALMLLVGLAMPISASAETGLVETAVTVKVDNKALTLKALAYYGMNDPYEPGVYKSYDFSAVSDHGYSTFFFNENGYGPKGSAGLVNGTYQIDVTETTGTDWHIKFEKNMAVKPGADYRLSYTFTSSVAGTVVLNGKWVEIQAGVNTVENTILAVAGDNLYTELQLGLLPAPFTVNISRVVVEESTGSEVYSDVTPADFRFDAPDQVIAQFYDGSEGSLETSAGGATLEITRAGDANGGQGGVWQTRMLIRTGMDLAAGKKYRISIDLESVYQYDCLEICYNNGDVEKGVDALYGQTLEPCQKKTFSVTVNVTEDKNDLTLQLQLGQLAAGVNANAVSATNLVIEEITGVKESKTYEYTFGPQGIGTFNDAGTGCEGYLYAQDGNLIYDMVRIGTVDWHSKMMIENVTLEAGKLYTIRFTAKADKNLSCAFFVNGQYSGWDPVISKTIHFTTEEQTYELKMDKALDADTVFQLLWQFGSDANHALGGARIQFSAIEIWAQIPE